MSSVQPTLLLERMLAYSAGLCHIRSHAQITAQYPALFQFLNLYAAFDRLFLREPDRISGGAVGAICDDIQRHAPADILLATFYYGHPLAFANCCARRGLPISLVYWRAEQPYFASLTKCGVQLVEPAAYRTAYDLFAALDRARQEGRYVAMLADAPSPARNRHEFLGYRVHVSALLELYARKTHARILPILTPVESENCIAPRPGKMLGAAPGITDALLRQLSAAIDDDSLQYRWSPACVLFSDPRAPANAVRFLLEALSHREKLLPAVSR